MIVSSVLGIHHVTAIASDPQRNLDFYVGLLGLRLVKRTVNFDDPETYQRLATALDAVKKASDVRPEAVERALRLFAPHARLEREVLSSPALEVRSRNRPLPSL